MRRLALIFAVLAGAASTFAVTAGADDERTYLIEMYNAFGIVEGSDVRVAGVNAGSVTDLEVNSAKRAVVHVSLSGPLATLGANTTCSTQPQSLIAEYFIDCQPDGPEIEPSGDPENPDVPAARVEQTVQPDLVANTLREPFKRRLQLLINEFGTALAGNPENLNEAIRLGAPALRELAKVLRIMGSQNRIIRDLNVNSDRIIGRLTERRADVVRFIQEARDTAAASAERRDDLSTDFRLLDDFLFELRPTLVQLEALAREQTPLLTDLRASAPGLNRLVLQLPAFNSATERSLRSLGDASVVGRRALTRGKEEIEALADAGTNARTVAEILADLLRDLDDPSRAVEADTRASDDTGRPEPTGYTGLEGLLNYAYYQAGALNQFDQVGHLLHFSLYYIFTGECGHWTSGRDPVTGEVSMRTRDGGTTDDPLFGSQPVDESREIAECIGWLGPNQPGITEDTDLPNSGLPRYTGGDEGAACEQNPATPGCTSVCPAGTQPAAALALCDPNIVRRAQARSSGDGDGDRDGQAGGDGTPGAPDVPDLPDVPGLPGGGNGGLDDLLERPRGALNDLRDGRGGGDGGGSGGGGQAVNDLLDFLMGP